MKKKNLTAVAAVIAFVSVLSACSEKSEIEHYTEIYVSETNVTSNDTYSSAPNKSETGSAPNNAYSSAPNEPETNSTSTSIDTSAPETNSSQSEPSSVTSEPTLTSEPQSSETSNAEPPAETSESNSPEWTETAVSAVLYVNTDNISSRIHAIQGSETVKQYRLNDKVTVCAKTDTDYYKLDDGSFIHSDYLSENEIKFNDGTLPDYTSVTSKGYTIERKNGVTYVDGILIANKTYTLPRDYGSGITSDTYGAFEEMRDAAARDGISLFIVSGFRSYYNQAAIYAQYVYNDGKENADTYSARAGFSEHQSGLALDLNSMRQSFADTAEGKWLAEHCAEYGFIIRYLKGKDEYTGYMYEPWHVRYIGKEKARIITDSGLSLEEYYGITSDYADCKYE